MKPAAITLIGAILCAATPSFATAQNFPPGALKIVVPYPPGGPIDFTARLLAQRLTDIWHKPVVVENKSGAASTIGTNAVVRAPKDGSVVLIATAGLSIQPAVYNNLPYDPLKDLSPVTRLASSASLLAVNPELPVHSVADLKTYLASHPSTPYGSQGVGSFSQLAMEIFLTQAGVGALHVPYRGSSPALQAIMAGETKLQFDIMMPMMAAINAGALRPIAVTSATRQPQLPKVETMAEAGIPEAAITSWTGIFAPAGTPPEIVARLDAAFRQALQEKAVVDKLAGAGYQTIGESSEEFARFFKADVARFAEAAKLAKLDKQSTGN